MSADATVLSDFFWNKVLFDECEGSKGHSVIIEQMRKKKNVKRGKSFLCITTLLSLSCASNDSLQLQERCGISSLTFFLNSAVLNLGTVKLSIELRWP